MSFLFDPSEGINGTQLVNEFIEFDEDSIEDIDYVKDSPFVSGDLPFFGDNSVSIEEEVEEVSIDDNSLTNAIYTYVEANPNAITDSKTEEEMLYLIQQGILDMTNIEVDLINLMRTNRESYPDTFVFLLGLWSGLVRTPKVYLNNPKFLRLFKEGVCVIYIPYKQFASGGTPSSWCGYPILRVGTTYVFRNKPIITNLKKTAIDATVSEFFAIKYSRNVIDEIADNLNVLAEQSECDMDLEIFTPIDLVEMLLEKQLDLDTLKKCVSEDKYRKVKRIMELNSDIAGMEW